jgi:hypothetical protein
MRAAFIDVAPAGFDLWGRFYSSQWRFYFEYHMNEKWALGPELLEDRHEKASDYFIGGSAVARARTRTSRRGKATSISQTWSRKWLA